MCHNFAYVMAAATGTREESERPAEWKREREADDDAEVEEAAVTAA